ncbi:hypothetical protein [Chamaesiphon sp. OTE_8_metabat_110]|uniref:hypothetical protein n=1 Tax=Chamaesiphon sp. OTE_8_metabat_110 TaxID=2964696 RepID=UPI00286A9B55|nr:hypothetical protein [Chamaesiphon sp. OTE_8_metabat_110]
MENCDRLIQFIDRHTNRGTEELPEIFGEGVGVEDLGVEYLDRFLDRDWVQLQSYWQSQSDYWIEALTLLLGDIDLAQSSNILVNIVLLGSDESALNAIEYVRDFIGALNPEVRDRIEAKMSTIVSKRF